MTKPLLLSFIVPIVFLIVSLMTINDYGETTDESAIWAIGEHAYHAWFKLDQNELLEELPEIYNNYGPLIGFISAVSYHTMHQQWKLIESPVASYHFPVILVCVVGLWAIFWLARSAWGDTAGVLSALSLALMPRFIGDSQNNIKDAPMAILFMITMLFYYRAVIMKSIWRYAIAGCFLGLTYCIKINALLVVPIILLWFLMTSTRRMYEYLRFIIGTSISVAAATLIVLLFWPYYRHETILRFVMMVHIFQHHPFSLPVTYMGQDIPGNRMLWHYPYVMLALTTPIFIMVGAFLGLIGAIFERKASKRGGRSLVLLCLVWLLFPLAVQSLSHAPMYDGVRHYLNVLPALALLAGYGLIQTPRLLALDRWMQRGIATHGYWVLVCGMFAVLMSMNMALHPYEVVYFNELTGGVKGAYGRFDLDYWGQSLKAAAGWLNAHGRSGSNIFIPFGSHQFPVDEARFRLTRNPYSFPDYKVIITRGAMHVLDPSDDYLRPSRPPAFRVSVQGADLVRIFEFPENHVTTAGSEIEPMIDDGRSRSSTGITRSLFSDLFFRGTPFRSEQVPFIGYDCRKDQLAGQQVGVRYQTTLSVQETGAHCFQIITQSDAGLWLNNRLILKIPAQKIGRSEVVLRQGVYHVRLDYVHACEPACVDIRHSIDGCQTFVQLTSR